MNADKKYDTGFMSVGPGEDPQEWSRSYPSSGTSLGVPESQ